MPGLALLLACPGVARWPKPLPVGISSSSSSGASTAAALALVATIAASIDAANVDIISFRITSSPLSRHCGIEEWQLSPALDAQVALERAAAMIISASLPEVSSNSSANCNRCVATDAPFGGCEAQRDETQRVVYEAPSPSACAAEHRHRRSRRTRDAHKDAALGCI